MDGWITAIRVPFGQWTKLAIDFVQTHAAAPIDVFATVMKAMIEGTAKLLILPPATVTIVVVTAFVWWLHRRWSLTAYAAVSLFAIANFGFWEATMETVALVGFATLLSVAIGVPIGIAAAHRPWVADAIRPLLDLMQTLPTFVYLIPTLVLFGLGVVPGLVSTVIFAIPAPIRLTQLGIASVPVPLREAGEAFGATRRQLLWKVELPHAMPMIMTGVNQCIMLSLSMVVVAALVGAGGLGKPVVRALNTVNVAMGFEAGLAIVLLAILLDRVCKRPRMRRRAP
ncbi:MAG: choline ABC transporter permease subunit [Siculibacillus sp.]|nr:choline ABC transporter permease subunit [Siculibacillus sp.]